MRFTRDAETAVLASAASQLARRADASVTARSTVSSETAPLFFSFSSRLASRCATSAVRQVARALALADFASARDNSISASRSLFQSDSSKSPRLTKSPLRTFKTAINPPVLGDKCARRQASTVPARVLAIVFSTTPGSAAATVTEIGRGFVACQ